MQNKKYIGSELGIFSKTAVKPNEDLELAKNAYNKFRHAWTSDRQVLAHYQGQPMLINTLFGKGGSKLVVNLGNTGNAVALLNIESNMINTESIEYWNRAIHEEVLFAQRLNQMGLCTQPYEKMILSIDGEPLQALKMPSFASMVEQGKQVRDMKNSNLYGTSLLFNNRANLQSPEHWQQILRGFHEDTVIYFTQNLNFETDTFNLAVVDTDETLDHDRANFELFSDHKQMVRFCFYDFSSKGCAAGATKYAFLNAQGQVDKELIQQTVNDFFDYRILSVITKGLLPIEYVNILGGIHTLHLVSNDTTIEDVPSQTMIVRKSNNEYCAYFNSEGVLKEKKLNLMCLLQLLHLFPDKGSSVSKKISVNEYEQVFSSITFACGCQHYSYISCVFDIHKIAKAVIEIVKPAFIESITHSIMTKLEQLSHEERSSQFDVHRKYRNMQSSQVLIEPVETEDPENLGCCILC